MHRSASPLLSCLVVLATSIALLGIAAIWPTRTAEVARGNGSAADSAATTNRVRIEAVAPSRLPPRSGDEQMSLVRRNDAIVRPLADLSLVTAPAAAGTSLLAERLTYPAGATISVRRGIQVRMVSLEAGTLDARIDGVAFLDRQWPAGSLLAREHNRVDGIVHLHPGDLLIAPAEAAFTAHNPGEVPAISLEVSVQLPLLLTPMTDRVTLATGLGSLHREHLAAAIATDPGVSAAVAIARITVPPGESFVIDGTLGPVLVLVERGRVSATREGSEVERAPGEAELIPQGELATIHSTGKAPLAVVVLTITPPKSDVAAV